EPGACAHDKSAAIGLVLFKDRLRARERAGTVPAPKRGGGFKRSAVAPGQALDQALGGGEAVLVDEVGGNGDTRSLGARGREGSNGGIARCIWAIFIPQINNLRYI